MLKYKIQPKILGSNIDVEIDVLHQITDSGFVFLYRFHDKHCPLLEINVINIIF